MFELLEWTLHDIENMNIFKRDILSKEVEGKNIICESKTKGKITYLVEEKLKNLKDVPEGNVVIVCFNSKENIDFLAKEWASFSGKSGLKIVFSNPDMNCKWTILPKVHDMIADRATLKIGLRSLGESVPLVD